MLCMCSVMPNCATPGTAAHQTPLPVRLCQQCCSELPFSPPGDLPDPESKPTSPVFPALGGKFFTTEPAGKPRKAY